MLWQFDPTHSTATFSSKHMMLTVVRGTMSQITGMIEYDPAEPEAARVEAIIPVSTFNTGVAERDTHLLSADFLDSERFSTLRFVSTQVEMLNETEAEVQGLLTLRDITQPITLKAELSGFVGSAWYNSPRVGFAASAIMRRERWGLTWNMGMEGGGYLVGRQVKIELDIEAVPAALLAPSDAHAGDETLSGAR